MAQQIPSLEQTQFGGVVTSGHPLQRPATSSTRCNNFRVMPGNWLRLRSGRVTRLTGYNSINRLHEVRLANGGNYVAHFFANDKGDGTSYWQNVIVNQYSYWATYFEPISRSYGYTEPGFPAIANCRNRVMMYNGLGVRGGQSYPALSQTFGDGGIRYVGLDCHCPSGPPNVSCVDSGSGTSHIVYSRDIYAGLYNSATGHFGNGIKIGIVASSNPGTTTRVTTVTATLLSRLTRAFHGQQTIIDNHGAQLMYSAESTEIFTVFYATVDGGSVPYLLVDLNGDPVKTQAASMQLDLDSLVCSTTQEMPRYNYPPRPMSSICYANGRVYGVPMPGGLGGGADFSYIWDDKQMAGVTWSAAADDSTDTDFLGIPEESWPLTNFKATPNGERPKHIAATEDGTRVLVVTQTGTFLLEETADGLHTWYTVSLTSGMWDARSFALTAYGLVWFTQRKQIVMLPHGSMTLQVLSSDYADLLKSPATKTPGAYVLDPVNLVDRYQLWLGDGTSVCHDFLLGQAYTTDGQNVTAAATLLDILLRPHHIMCIGGAAYTQEGQVDAGYAVPVADQQEDLSYQDFQADYIGQWVGFGEFRARKEISEWAITGDGGRSPELQDSPLSVSWYGDLSSDPHPVTLKKLAQSDTDMAYLGKISAGSKRWWKGRIQLRSHYQDAGATYVPATANGDLTPNVYGSIWESALTVNPNGNR
jgi:hypothetical protein